jgi:hypothetical protein
MSGTFLFRHLSLTVSCLELLCAHVRPFPPKKKTTDTGCFLGSRPSGELAAAVAVALTPPPNDGDHVPDANANGKPGVSVARAPAPVPAEPNRTDGVHAAKENRKCRWLRKEGRICLLVLRLPSHTRPNHHHQNNTHMRPTVLHPRRQRFAAPNQSRNNNTARTDEIKNYSTRARAPTNPPAPHCTCTSESKGSSLTDRCQLTQQHVEINNTSLFHCTTFFSSQLEINKLNPFVLLTCLFHTFDLL